MNVEEMTEEFLVCPKCHGHLEYVSLMQEDGKKGYEILICEICGVYYPIEDGIPILLIEEAKKIDK